MAKRKLSYRECIGVLDRLGQFDPDAKAPGEDPLHDAKREALQAAQMRLAEILREGDEE